MLYFIGIVISDPSVNEELLYEEFQNSIVSWRNTKNGFCIYYKDKLVEAKDDGTLTPDQLIQLSLTENQLQHLINTLKRVRSDILYNSYPDDLDIKKITIKTTPVFKPKV